MDEGQSRIVQAITGRIDERLATTTRLLIAIDGRCAAGKTTLAAYLMDRYHATLIHMDDFFLRPEQRTAERLNEPGGNVDYERFLQEVLLPLRAGNAFSYRPYDCHRQTLTDPLWVEPHAVCIVEGSYSCHPTLWSYYDLHIFLTVKPDEQMRRIALRNGESHVEQFRQTWIPLEERYFTTYRIMERCDPCCETG